MLSIGKLAAGCPGAGSRGRGVEYYLATVASGIEDYYTGAGEAPGRWLGGGASDLGLAGSVDAEHLRAVMGGRHPLGGHLLVGAKGRPRTVPGFDLTFSAPKSVSLLYAFGDVETRRAVVAAHDGAVASAVIEYLEQHAVWGRELGERAGTTGAVVAAFRHRTSRAGDPDLHTHALVANLVHRGGGRWGALDARALYTHAKAAGYCYQADLRHRLTDGLGVEWSPVQRGVGDVAGVPRSVIEAFSTRAAEIKAELARRGETGMRASHVAALATRRAKEYGIDGGTLHARWAARGYEVGFDAAAVEELVRRTTWRSPTKAEREQLYDEQASPSGLTAHDSTYGRRDVVMALAARAPAGAPVADIERWTDQYLASERALLVADPAVGTTRTRGDQRAPAPRELVAERDEVRYSTPELVALERRLVAGAVARQRAGAGVADKASLDAALARRANLTGEQVAAVRSLTTSGAGVEVVAAAAGSGKTYALDAARDGWQSAGYRVIGAGLAARYAAELESAAGIPSFTVDGLLRDLADPRCGGLGERTVLVVDEANTVGTRRLAELAGHAQRAGAKVVLVGDERQLAEIDAGGAFAALARRLGAHGLTANLRQHDQWQRDALAALRRGDAEVAVASYAGHGAMVTAETADDVRARLVIDYLGARDRFGTHPNRVAMFAPRRPDAEDLNQRVRAALEQRGELAGPSLEVGGRTFAVGDRVMATRNAPVLGVRNGTRGDVVAVDAQSRRLVVHTDAGRDVTIGARYLDAGHLVHGYATTAHKVEGMTVDAALFLGDRSVYREMAYVAMSRGRAENRFYVVADREEDPDPGRGRDTVLRDLAGSLARSRAKALAVDAAGERGLADVPLADLYRMRDDLRAQLTEMPRTAAERRAASREHGALAQRHAAVDGVIARREARAVSRAVAAQPAYIVGELGPRPEDWRRREQWRRGVGVIERHRLRWGVHDQDRAFGRAVSAAAREREREARAALERIAADLERGHGGPRRRHVVAHHELGR